MIMAFTLDQEVVAVYRTAQTVRSVVQRIDGSKPQGDFTYHGKSKDGGIAEHRIREIKALGDLGTTYTNSTHFFEHHTKEGIFEIDSHIEHWDFMTKYLGREDVFKKVKMFIDRASERMHPACCAISDADSSGSARNSYQEIEDRWSQFNTKQQQYYQVQKKIATQTQKRVLREEEIALAKEILKGFRDDVASWVTSVKTQIA